MNLGSRHTGSDEPEINLVSLIDVLFCLILFLVVTTTFTQRSVLKIQLPQAQAGAQAEAGPTLTIAIDRDGKYFVNNNEVLKSDIASLKEAIARVAGDDRSQQVILRADGRTAHQAVVTAEEALGQLGFARLSIATHRGRRRPAAVIAPAPPADFWRTYRRLLRHAAPYWPLMLAAALGMIAEAGAAGYFTALMKPMVDLTFVARNPDVRLTLPLTILGLFMLRGVATFVTDIGMARTGQGLVRDLQITLFEKFLHLPSSRYDAEPVPALLSRLSYDTTQMAGAITDALKVLVTDTLTIAVMLGVMLYQSFAVTVAMIVIGPAIALISSYVSKRYRRINRGIQEAVAHTGQASMESLVGHQEVKVYGTQQLELDRFRELTRRNLRLSLKIETTRGAASSTVQLLGACALALILFLAGLEAARGHMSAGGFVTIMTSMMVMLPSLKRIANVQSPLQRGISSAERLFALLDEPGEDDRGTRALDRARGELEFRDVGLRYAGQERAALEHLSLRAKPGTVTAIVGRSGSGKTTLVRLIPRFYEPTSGRVLLDGLDLAEYRLADLRRQIALVGQRVMLLDDTVAANIAYARPGATPEQIRRAADAANATEFIDRLPQGMDTRIGENGSLLSGGQRQRLAIARAILKDAPILILDEATAALDNESERLVQEALNGLVADRTTLVIAHRLSTIEHADQVLVMDEGRLVEQGTHAELLARGGAYARLHRMQFRDPEAA